MAGHTHWRIFIRYNNDNNYVGLNELQLRGVAGGPDLTQTIGGIATASAARAGRGAGNAFDGDPATIWDADNVNRAYGFWLAFEFPTAQDIVQIAAMPNSENTDRTPWLFEFQFSDDGAAWSLAWLCTCPTYDGAGFVSTYTVGTYALFTKPALAAATRYFLTLSLGQQSSGAFSQSEMRLFETGSGANVCIGKGGLTDSQFDGTTGPPKAFDNNLGTFYGGNGGVNGQQYVAVDFGAGNAFAPTIMQLVARNDGNFGQGSTSGLCYKSDDGKSWAAFGSYNGFVYAGAGSMQEVTFTTAAGAIVSQLVVICVDYENENPGVIVNFQMGGAWGFPHFIERI